MTVIPRPALSVVTPCFNEEAVLPEFIARVGAVLDGLGWHDAGQAEIVMVDDGSRDGTWRVMSEAAAADKRIVAVRLMRNHGHQLALTAGLNVCHCTDCQRQSGSAFSMSLRVTASAVHFTKGQVKTFQMAGESGKPKNCGYECHRR